MKIAIVGSRNVVIGDLDRYISDADEIVSGGAKGVDSSLEIFYFAIYKFQKM